MRKLTVYRNNIEAGMLIEESRESYVFRYSAAYFFDPGMPAISLTIPKNQQEHRSPKLFPFFYNMLAEGVNKTLQNRTLRIDENDFWGLLAATAQYDTIGAITVKPADQ